MLSYRRDQLLTRYSENTVKVHKVLLKEFGYMADNNYIEIAEYRIFCTPSTFSLNTCTLILSLKESEIQFFSKYFDKISSLYFGFKAPEEGEKRCFVIRGIIKETKRIEGHEDLWMFTFNIKSRSDCYLRHFLLMSELSDRLHETYSQTNQAVFGPGMLSDILGTDTVLISKGQAKIGYAHIISVSAGRMQIELKLNSSKIEKDEILSLLYTRKNESGILKGKISRIENSETVKGFHDLWIDLDFHMEFVNLLLPYSSPGEVEEIEETE